MVYERRESASAFAKGFRRTLGNVLAIFIAGAGGFAWTVDMLFQMKTQLGFMQVQLAAVPVPLDGMPGQMATMQDQLAGIQSHLTDLAAAIRDLAK